MNESNSFRPGSTWEFRGMPSVHLLGKTKIIVEEREAERVCRKRCTSRHRHEERTRSISKEGKGHLKHLENRPNISAFKEGAGDLAPTNHVRPISLIYAMTRYRVLISGIPLRFRRVQFPTLKIRGNGVFFFFKHRVFSSVRE